MKRFQTILIGVFILFIIVAILIFSGAIKLGDKGNSATAGASGKVVMWGTIPKDSFTRTLSEFNNTNKTFTVSYVQKSPETFNTELIEALASGVGPDMILLPSDLILRYSDKLVQIPFTSLPERSFRDTFVSEADLYINSKGIFGFPLTIDPMVMYYNRSMFESAGLATYPKNWDEVLADVPLLIKKDSNAIITQNAVALGEFSNVTYAKDIIALMSLQRGGEMVSEDNRGILSSVFGKYSGSQQDPAASALSFYTSFANPTNKDIYSWNKSFPQSRDQFIAGKLAMYFGYASDLFTIQSKNPNLDFDIATMPTLNATSSLSTFGKMTAVAVLKSSKNVTTAYVAGNLMTAPTFLTSLVTELSEHKISLVPARRDLLTTTPETYYAPIFYKSALVSRGWLDPKDEQTDIVFSQLIDDINSGRLEMSAALNKTSIALDALLRTVTY